MLSTVSRRVNGRLRQDLFTLKDLSIKSDISPRKKKIRERMEDHSFKNAPPPLFLPSPGRSIGPGKGLSKSRIKLNQEMELKTVSNSMVGDMKLIAGLATRPGGLLGRMSNGDKAARGEDVRPGDLVILLGDHIEAGIVLPLPPDDSTSVSMTGSIVVLRSMGELRISRSGDVIISIPNFANSDELKQVYNPAIDGSETSIEEEEFDERRTRRRGVLCRRIRLLMRQVEFTKQAITPAFESLFLADDANFSVEDDEVTTVEIAEKLANHELTKVVQDGRDATASGFARLLEMTEAAVFLATHELMTNHPEIFAMNSLQHVRTHSFSIRPLEDRKASTKVLKWIQSSLLVGSGESAKDNPIRSFTHKAKKTIERRKSAGEAVDDTLELGPPRTVELTQEDHLDWTPEDFTILQFLRATLGNVQRSEVSNPYATSAMYIAKRCGLEVKLLVNARGEDRDVRDSHFESLTYMTISRLLTDLGLLCPWDNPATVSTEFRQRANTSYPAPRQLQEVDEDDHLRKDVYERVYAIDDIGAKELDDGVSIERTSNRDQYWVHVDIADPTTRLKPSDEMAKAARKRHASYYFAQAFWPMLPHSFTDPFGLRVPLGGQDAGTPSMRFSAKVDMRDGRVSDINVGLARLRNIKVISYDAVEDILTGTAESSEKSNLTLLHKAASKLEKRRQEVGGAFEAQIRSLNLDVEPILLPESPIWQLTDSYCPPTPIFAGFPKIHDRSKTQKYGDRSSQSQALVKEMMVLAGRVAGKWASSRGLPLLYRGQPCPPSEKDLKKVLDLRKENGSISFEEMVQSQVSVSSARGAIEPIEHFSMGINTPLALSAGKSKQDLISDGGYVRLTSPLRRYHDMLNHWQVRHVLRSGSADGVPFTRQDLKGELTRQIRLDAWVRSNEKRTMRNWFAMKLWRGLEARRNGLRLSEEEQAEVGVLLDTVYDAVITIADVRTTITFHGVVRAQILDFGLPLEVRWDPDVPISLGSVVKVKICDILLSSTNPSFIARPA